MHSPRQTRLVFGLIAFAVAVLIMSTVTRVAHAAPCAADPSITVITAGGDHVSGQAVSYTFSGCHNSVGDRLAVQALRAERDTAGTLAETPAAQTTVITRAGQTGSFSGNGSFVPSSEGRYVVRVLYFAAGQNTWEMKGEAIVRVAPLPEPPQPPTPDPEPPVVPTPDTEPQPELIGTPAPTPDEPQPQPIGRRAAKAKIALTKRATRPVVKAGGVATFTLTVRNTSKITARSVRVCDRLPKHMQYVGASTKVNFDGPNACVKAGNMKTGASRKFTLRFKVDRTAPRGRIVNRATATAANAKTVRAKASVKVPTPRTPRIKAPVTG
jgi:uncharacterized repeat protein (TIGR01451 family)